MMTKSRRNAGVFALVHILLRIDDDSFDGAFGRDRQQMKLAADRFPGADVTDDSLSGADIDEASLQVKSEVMPISARVPAGTVATPLYSANGLSVALDCGAGGSATISRTNVNGFFAEEGRSFSSLPNVLNEGTASNASVISMAANSHIDDHLTFRRSSDGAVVTADLVLVTTDSQVGTDCLAMGNAFASRGG